MLKGHRRKELIDDKMRKPVFSVRRVKYLCRWINSLHMWQNNLDILTLHKEMCSGLLLARLMQLLIPSAKFVNLNARVRTRKAAEENLEQVSPFTLFALSIRMFRFELILLCAYQALGFIWRTKSFNMSRIPKASEIVEGSTAKISSLLQEVFEVYVIKPLYTGAIKMLRWYHSILKQYELPMAPEIFAEGDLQFVWPHFQSGTALFCIIYHLHGPIVIGEGARQVRIDPLRVMFDAQSIREFRANIVYVFSLLHALNIEVLWDVDDWLTYPDTGVVLLQLNHIYETLKVRQCSLPPAQGTNAGVTSGPNGEPMVVGLVFGDTLPAAVRGDHRRRTVLLGSGESALAMMPIDTGGKVGRFISTSNVPLGLLCNDVKIIHASMQMQSTGNAKRDWITSVLPKLQEEKLAGSQVSGNQCHRIFFPQSQ